MLGSGTIPAQQTIASFHQGLAWVAQLGMFLTLGLLVFPSQLGDIARRGHRARDRGRRRGAAAGGDPGDAVRALLVARERADPRLGRPARGGAGGARDLPGDRRGPAQRASSSTSSSSPCVVSTIAAGHDVRAAGAPPRASRRASPRCRGRSPRAARSGASARRSSSTRSRADDAIVGHRVRDLGLPRDAVVNVIVREGQAIPPRGTTRLRAGDRLHVLIRQESARELYDIRDRWHSGPIGRAAAAARRPARARGDLLRRRLARAGRRSGAPGGGRRAAR